MTAPGGRPDGKMEDAARLAAERVRRLRDDPEPSFALRLGQIGVLGWAIVAPILIGVVIGRWLDWALARPASSSPPRSSCSGPRRAYGPHGDGCTGNDARLSSQPSPRARILGAAHFGSLWCSVVLMRDGRTALGVAVQALRFAALAVALALVAREGAAPLLAAAFGLLAARALLMRRYRRLA